MGEFVSCSVWPLAVGIDFEHMKVEETLVLKLKVPCPNFPIVAKMMKMILSCW
jgi:hypothetical protein